MSDCLYQSITSCVPISYKILLFLLFQLLVLPISSYTCSSSVSDSLSIFSEEGSYVGYTTAKTYGVQAGSTSNSMYYLDQLCTASCNAAVRRINSNGSLVWMTSLSFDPILKSLSVDLSEQNIYFASFETPLIVAKLNAVDGGIVSTLRFTGVSGENYGIKLHLFSDNSGFIFIGKISDMAICKYLFSQTGITSCQQITTLYTYGYGQLKLSNTQLFLTGADRNSPYNFHAFKITFGSSTSDWSKKILCPTNNCRLYPSESLLSQDSSLIYSFFSYGDPSFCYFVKFNASDGNVIGSKYKSNLGCPWLIGSAQNGYYLVASTFSTSAVLLFYNTITSTFSCKDYYGKLYQIANEQLSERIIIVGTTQATNCYTTKFQIQLIDEHPALTTSNFEMNALASGTDEIVDESEIAVPSSSSVVFTFVPYTNQSIEYSKISSYMSDIRYQLETQSLFISENNQERLILDLSCSSSGSTKISYSIASYSGVDIPSFVSVDSSTGILNIEAPSVSSSTEYSFYINSSISGVTNSIQKIIKLTVNKCTSSNCQKCKSHDSLICSVCDSEYVLSSGSCSAASQTSESLTTTTQVLYGTTVGAVLFLSFLNASSVASLWSMINQAQIFFLLLLTGAYIPADIKLIIIGMKICLNPYYYFQSSKGDSSNIVENYFNFGLEDVRLESLGIKSDSTAVNIYSFIISIFVIMSIHLCLLLIQCCCKKCCKEENQSCALKVTKWTLSKLSLLFEFALYIRIILKINQYLLISSISEIYHFNYSDIKRIISLIISLFVFILCLCIILFVLIFVFLKEDTTKNRNKFAQLFNGIKKQKTFKFYITALLIRRIILVLILITIVPDSSTAAIIICFIIQFIYMLYVIFLRPYSEIKSNIIEAVNEIYFIVMLGSLFYYNSESRWSSTPTSAYTWVMTSNSFSSFTIIIGDLIRKIILKCKSKCSSNIVQSSPKKSHSDNDFDNIEVSNNQMSNLEINRDNPKSKLQYGHKIGNRVYFKR